MDSLLERISAFTRADYSGRYEWINGITEDSRNAVWLFDLRIAFLTSAHSSGIQVNCSDTFCFFHKFYTTILVQSKWGNSAVALSSFIDIIRQYTATAAEVRCFEPEEASRRLADHTDRAGEAAKVLFNITYKRPNDIDEVG